MDLRVIAFHRTLEGHTPEFLLCPDVSVQEEVDTKLEAGQSNTLPLISREADLLAHQIALGNGHNMSQGTPHVQSSELTYYIDVCEVLHQLPVLGSVDFFVLHEQQIFFVNASLDGGWDALVKHLPTFPLLHQGVQFFEVATDLSRLSCNW